MKKFHKILGKSGRLLRRISTEKLTAAAVRLPRSTYGLAGARERGERENSVQLTGVRSSSPTVCFQVRVVLSLFEAKCRRRCDETRSLGSSVLGLF